MNELDVKITNAMHRIEDLYYSTNGKCFVAFSGGKDSTVILALIKMCEEIYTIPEDGIKAVFCDTGIELGATRDFVRWCKDSEWYSNIEIIRPKVTFKWILDNYGKPMKSKIKSDFISRYQKKNNMNAFKYLIYGQSSTGKKYIKTKIADKDLHILSKDFDISVSNNCCEFLKKRPSMDFAKENDMKGQITGIRTSEGGVRELSTIKRLKDGGKLCTAKKGDLTVKMPIIDWTDDDIEQFIDLYNVPLSKAYTEYGMDRTGCIGCPFSRELKENLKVLYNYEPNRYKASMFWLKDVYIAQNVILPFDEQYEVERKKKWSKDYERMRYEMLKKYRPDVAERYNSNQATIDELL